MNTLIDLPDRLTAVNKTFLKPVADAARAADEAQVALAEAQHEAMAKHQRSVHLQQKRRELVDRISLCTRDWPAEKLQHEATVTEFFGRRDLSPFENSRLQAAVLALACDPGLNRVVPKLKRQLETELAELDQAITEAEPPATPEPVVEAQPVEAEA